MFTIHHERPHDNDLYIGMVIVSPFELAVRTWISSPFRCRSSVYYMCHQKAQVLYTKLALTKTTGVFRNIEKYCTSE